MKGEYDEVWLFRCNLVKGSVIVTQAAHKEDGWVWNGDIGDTDAKAC